MRKITFAASRHFAYGMPFKQGNTEVKTETIPATKDLFAMTAVELYLHGNLIAQRINGVLLISNGGWFSNTTKERLNGLNGVNIQQHKHVWYLNSKEWNGSWTRVNNGMTTGPRLTDEH